MLDPRNVNHLLCGIKFDGRRSARHNDVIRSISGETIGAVTSGSFSPSLERAIAMGYIRKQYSFAGNKVIVATDRSDLTGTIVETPFYKSGTARRALSDFLA
jgi:aminomethyltransferase